MQVIIDRFEGNYAVVELENKTFVHLPRTLVPAEAREGDTLEIAKIETDRKERINALVDALFDE